MPHDWADTDTPAADGLYSAVGNKETAASSSDLFPSPSPCSVSIATANTGDAFRGAETKTPLGALEGVAGGSA